MELHWLSVPERIQFKLVVLVFRCLRGTAPPYIADQMQPVDARSLGVTQKASILGLGQTGHPDSTTDYHRRQCILYHWSSCVEQFVVIDTECIFVACI